jgi:probable F420-dependent oxidoreductase
VDLGSIGVWTGGRQWEVEPAEVAAAGRLVEELGYRALWVGTMPGTSAGELALPEALLAATDRLVVATGILDVWSNPPEVVAASHARLHERYPGRFLLGLGSSHAPLIQSATGEAYVKPLQQIDGFLDALDAAEQPVPRDERIIGALGPAALRQAGERSLGAHPYLVPPEHTAAAREAMGPDAVLAPELVVLLTTDPDRAREVGRQYLALYLTLPNYVRNLRRFGFVDEDFADGGSDRLVDALVAWGDLDAVEQHVDAHLAAGADHVALQVLSTEDEGPLPLDAWRAAAPIARSTAT